MKLLHLADLHFGKSLHNFPLLEDQARWTDRMLEAVHRERPDAVLIAGDVYDRGVPSKEAVQLLSRMLTELSRAGVEVFLTAGNHDGGERLEFASEILASQRVHIAGTVQPEMTRATLFDQDGPVTFWLMPYTTPAAVRTVLNLDEAQAGTYTDAIRALLEHQTIRFEERNVLIAHQTVFRDTERPVHSASETAIAGIGGVDAAVFSGFDYVALGHIHGAQQVGSRRVRYAGAPLCYHFSEAGQQKGLSWVTLGKKGTEPGYRMEKIPPLHAVRETIVGNLEDILAAEKNNPARGEYVQVVLTDGQIAPEARETLSALFESHGSKLLDLSRKQFRNAVSSPDDSAPGQSVSLRDYFCEFYRSRALNFADPSRGEMELITLLAEQIENRGEEDGEKLVAELADAALKQAASALGLEGNGT